MLNWYPNSTKHNMLIKCNKSQTKTMVKNYIHDYDYILSAYFFTQSPNQYYLILHNILSMNLQRNTRKKSFALRKNIQSISAYIYLPYWLKFSSHLWQISWMVKKKKIDVLFALIWHATRWPLFAPLTWYLVILNKLIWLIWRLDTQRWNLQVSNLQISYTDLTKW